MKLSDFEKAVNVLKKRNYLIDLKDTIEKTGPTYYGFGMEIKNIISVTSMDSIVKIILADLVYQIEECNKELTTLGVEV